MKNLFKSLAAFQQECPTIHKGTKGYGYSYADLPTIFEKINPIMKKHGLGFWQGVEGNALHTTVFHIDSGEVIESVADIPQDVQLKGMNDFQVLGSAITYMRRYQLSAMLGIVTDKDTDAAGEQKKPEDKPVAKKGLPVITPESPNFSKFLDAVKKDGFETVKARAKGTYEISKEATEIAESIPS
jgi:hypothetical protein